MNIGIEYPEKFEFSEIGDFSDYAPVEAAMQPVADSENINDAEKSAETENIENTEKAEKAEIVSSEASSAEYAEIKSEMSALRGELAEIKQMLSSVVPPAKKKPTTKQQIDSLSDEMNEIKKMLSDLAKKQ